MGTMITMESLITLLIIVLALTGPLYAINQKKDSTALGNEFLAKDIALTLESLMSNPGNVVLDYSQNVSKRTFIIEKDKVTVFYTGKEAVKYVAPLNHNPAFKINFNTFKPEKTFRFEKNGNEITILMDDEKRMGADRLNCPNIKTVDNNWKNKRFLIDLSHGTTDEDKGNKFGELNEKQIVDEIGNYLSSNLETVFTRTIGTNLEGDRNDRITDDIEAVLSLNVGSQNLGNEVIAYIDIDGEKSEESYKMACMVVNSIAGKIDTVTQVGVMPITTDIDENDMIIGHDKIAVHLEIGNLQDPDSREMLKKTADIGQGIYFGLEGYYN